MTDAISFTAWPKTPRLFRDPMVITEKIDGTNSAVGIVPYFAPAHGDWPTDVAVVLSDQSPSGSMLVYAQSRNRLITPATPSNKAADNYGFAGWVWDNAAMLVDVLGEGLHFGEWWGEGIGRKYGMTEKRLSLFNTARFGWLNEPAARLARGVPGQLGVVPVLRTHTFSTEIVRHELAALRSTGSIAAPGFMEPEGICVYLPSARQVYKVTFDGDQPKSVAA